jgi:3-oxoacyl-[acyl-carrier protein] reductase
VGKLDGKVAIVTGAGRGIGRACAKRLAGLGAKVAVFDVNLDSYQEYEAQSMTAPGTVAEIEQSGGTAMGLAVDVTDPTAVNAAVAQVVDAWGRIDILVANAGGGMGFGPETKAGNLDPALTQLVMANNFYGTVNSVTAVAPIMKQQHSGKIVTVSSVAALRATADGGVAHYGAAKAAIAHYTRYLAQDLGPFGITANGIAPGVTATGRISAQLLATGAQVQGHVESIPLRRIGNPEDCAAVVEFLATDLSDYVSGIVIPVDGGMSSR